MKKLLLYSTLLFAFSCTKLVEMPNSNTPQFEMHMDVDGDSMDLVAGDGDVYYQTSFEEVNGVVVYSGEFIFDGGNQRLKFELFDHSNSYQYGEGVDLFNDFTGFSKLTSQPVGYLFYDSSAIYGQSVTGIEWLVNGVIYNDNFELFNEPGIYDVLLNLEFDGGQTSSLSHKVYLGFDNPCWGYFDVIDHGYGEFEFQSHIQNSATTIEWVVDGDVQGSQSSLISILDTGVHKVGMRVTDQLGHEYYREKNIGHEAQNYIQEFGFLKQNSLDLHNTMIITYEVDGNVFTSRLLNQDNGFITAGNESEVMEAISNLVLQYPVDMQFKLVNENDFTDTKSISLTGKLGFLVEK